MTVVFRNQEVLKDASWEVKTGDRVGLVGPNGCGKTTMIKVITSRLLFFLFFPSNFINFKERVIEYSHSHVHKSYEVRPSETLSSLSPSLSIWLDLGGRCGAHLW